MNKTVSLTRSLRSFLCAVVALAFVVPVLFPGTVRAQQDDKGSWTEMIRKEQIAVDMTQRDLKTYISAQPERLKKISEKTEQLQQEAMRLSIRYNMLSGNPVETRDILRQMTMVRDQTTQLILPVKEELNYADNLKKLFQNHLSEYERLAESESAPEIGRSAAKHVESLKNTIRLIETAIDIIEIVPNAADQLIARLEPRRVMVEKDLRSAWKKYFLESPSASFFQADAWKLLPSVYRTTANAWGYWLIPYVENKGVIVGTIVKGLLFSIGMFIAALVILLRLRRKHPSLRLVRRFLPFVCLAALGIPLMLIGAGTSLGPLSTVTFIAEIILAAALTSLAWNLRCLASDDPRAFRHNPLWPYWVVLAAGIIVQLVHAPMILYSLPLTALFIVVGVFCQILKRHEAQPLNRRLISTDAVLSYLLALTTFLGWGGLALLAAAVWFAVVLNVELAAGLTGCFRKLRIADAGDATPQHTITHGVAFPMIFLGLFSITALWIVLYVGGMPLVTVLIKWQMIIGYLSLNLSMAIVIIAILFIARSIVVLVNALITFMGTRLSTGGMGEGVIKSLHAISTYVIWSLYILVSLKLIGVSVTHLAIIAGGLSIGAGFGLQDMIKNFFGGLVLLFGRSIHPGDEIQLGDIRGTVMRVNIRNTIVQTNEDSTIFIPNSDLINKNITNWTYRDPRGRAEIAVAVAYGSDTARVRDILVRCAMDNPGVLKEPPPYVLFWDFGDNALAFRLRFWIRRPVQARDRTASAIRFEIEKAFKEENIRMAYPQDVNIHLAEGPKTYRPGPDKAR